MNKRSLEPVILRQNDRLEADEKKLRRELRRLHISGRADIADAISDAYAAATVGDELTHRGLMQHIDRDEYTRMMRRLRSAETEAGDNFPSLSFDRLNKLDGVRYDLRITGAEMASAEERLIRAHLQRHAEACWEAFCDWLDFYAYPMTAAVLAGILDDKRYPIHETIRSNHRKIADQATEKIEQDIIRGMPLAQARNAVTDYVIRREDNRADSVLYYEGTRVTTETLATIAREAGFEYFHSVVADGLACGRCKDIAKEQTDHPLPLSELDAGLTAPPFHSFCRCHVEVF